MNENIPSPDETVVVRGVSFTHEDLFRVVDDFYSRIQKDPVLQVPFRSVHDWPEHVQRLIHFWWSRFGGRVYLFNYYRPVEKHFFAGFDRSLLKRWLDIFHETLQSHLKPEQVETWRSISEKLGEALAMKNDEFARVFIQKNSN